MWGKKKFVKRVITSEACVEIEEPGDGFAILEKRRGSFINRSRFRRLVGNRKLGLTWLVLDPLVISLIYLFVFTVIRSNPNPETIFIGITLFRIMQKSFLGGTAFISDFSGGIRAERVSSKALLNASLKFRLIDSFLLSIGVGMVLFGFFGYGIAPVLCLLLVSQVIGFLFEGFGITFFLAVKRIPDLNNIFRYFLQLLFFASPCLYPMSRTTGLHYQLNEFNPYSYFVEFVRLAFELDSVFEILDMKIFSTFLLFLIALSFRGYSSIDNFRWEVSRWGE